MNEHLYALLIHEPSETFDSLRQTLRELSVETYSVPTCRQAQYLISQCKPQMVFCERTLRDGSWQTILGMAEDASCPLSVVVVASVPHTQTYLSVMERGAFDFVAPPFEREPLKFIARSAALNTRRLREALVHASGGLTEQFPVSDGLVPALHAGSVVVGRVPTGEHRC